MEKRNQINFATTGGLLIFFILYTIALMYIDVKPIGPRGSSVGFAAINEPVKHLLDVNMFLYNITDWLGLVAILVALGFAVLGLVQLIKRKSLFRVDSSILILGGFYLLVMAAYLFFEYNIVNYRPVLINNVLEASYPSSTTMLVMCVMPTAMIQFHRLIQNKTVRIAINTLFGVFTVTMIIGRMLSGVHWLTDILGGVLLSSMLFMLFYSVNQYVESKQSQQLDNSVKDQSSP
ncbi:MAG: phosphatase PAP2 family protein [Desulfotomaculaceae bacterium]|nr:phosphatase PAP2 family protein [Desulfotomaculaceae bacterium]